MAGFPPQRRVSARFPLQESDPRTTSVQGAPFLVLKDFMTPIGLPIWTYTHEMKIQRHQSIEQKFILCPLAALTHKIRPLEKLYSGVECSQLGRVGMFSSGLNIMLSRIQHTAAKMLSRLAQPFNYVYMAAYKTLARYGGSHFRRVSAFLQGQRYLVSRCNDDGGLPKYV